MGGGMSRVVGVPETMMGVDSSQSLPPHPDSREDCLAVMMFASSPQIRRNTSR